MLWYLQLLLTPDVLFQLCVDVQEVNCLFLRHIVTNIKDIKHIQFYRPAVTVFHHQHVIVMISLKELLVTFGLFICLWTTVFKLLWIFITCSGPVEVVTKIVLICQHVAELQSCRTMTCYRQTETYTEQLFSDETLFYNDKTNYCSWMKQCVHLKNCSSTVYLPLYWFFSMMAQTSEENTVYCRWACPLHY